MNKNIPLYLRIAEYYKGLIIGKVLNPGDKIPTEEEICRLFSASRITVRHALDILLNQEYIQKQQGKGSFVALKKTDLQLNTLNSFSEDMLGKGLTPSAKIISVNLITPPPCIAEKLQTEKDALVYSIVRLRCADGIPMAYENAYLPFKLFSGIDKHDLTGSLYKILDEFYGIKNMYAIQSIESGMVNAKIAEYLKIKSGSPVLLIERITCLSDNTPFEYVESTYRGDKYKFYIKIERN